MAIDAKIYDTHELLGVYEQLEPVSSYWLDLCFPTTVTSDNEYIDFEKITNTRKLAPLVTPSSQGRPIGSGGTNVTRFKPAYVKPKDPVDLNRMIKRGPGEMLNSRQLTPQQRYNAAIAAIGKDHRDAILRRCEWLAAEAIINGQVTLVDADYPETTISFGRANNHTITKTGGDVWTTSYDIIGDLNTWIARVSRAPFGGVVDRLTLGADAAAVFLKNTGVKEQLDTTLRGSQANLNTGVRNGAEVQYLGNIGFLPVYMYSAYYESAVGTAVNYMDPKAVVLTGPNVQGVRAFGAIMDADAQLQALPMFPKMWKQPDPSATFVMTQSAPLMVPVNPNNTLKAKVLV